MKEKINSKNKGNEISGFALRPFCLRSCSSQWQRQRQKQILRLRRRVTTKRQRREQSKKQGQGKGNGKGKQQKKQQQRQVLRDRGMVYIPPFAMRLRRMGHPAMKSVASPFGLRSGLRQSGLAFGLAIFGTAQAVPLSRTRFWHGSSRALKQDKISARLKPCP